ncbi:SDR family NAD(P)-dependent oxidoreductase [Neorhizobium sp. NPDC001467]|uniref:SDR family NAD(P)-dependent oxidoreductase n=1 Tax=Neorhizobium sp. NPDC001467 TaxID=3390595 RepID=UPI003D02D7E1
MRLIASFLPHFMKQKETTVLVATSSLAFVPKAIFPTYCGTKAFLHSRVQSLRRQLRDVPVEVLELVPPYVRTELNGPSQASDPRGMDVEEFVSEALGLLEARDHAGGEVLVQRARLERQAERDGIYDAIYGAANP